MTHRRKKIAKILEELTIYFFAVGADSMKSEIKMGEKEAIIDFQANFLPDFRRQVLKIEQYFNEQKNEGLEDFYWELAGSGDPGETSQLLLVGMMIDRAEVAIGETDISMKLYKRMDEDKD